jgi:ABC-2 type transport system ATP-binding protein
VRELMRRLGNEGRTVFVSSHILNEVQQTADRVAILARGRQVATGPVHEVLTTGHATGLIVRLDDVAEGLRILGEAGIDARVDDGVIRVGLPPADAARVTRTLADRGLYLTELRADEVDLETVFLELTRGASTEGRR